MLKPIGLTSAWNRPLTPAWCYHILLHWSFGKYQFTELHGACKWQHISLPSITTHLKVLGRDLRNDSGVGRLSSSPWIQVPETVCFLLSSSNVQLTVNTSICLSRSGGLISFVLENSACPSASLPGAVPPSEPCPTRQAASSACGLAHVLDRVHDKHWNGDPAGKVNVMPSLVPHRPFKGQNGRLNCKMISSFYCFITDHLKQPWHWWQWS